MGFFSKRRVEKNSKVYNVETSKKEMIENIEKKDLVWPKKGSIVPVEVITYGTLVSAHGDDWEILDSNVWGNRLNKLVAEIQSTMNFNKSKYCPIPKKVELRIYLDEEKKKDDKEQTGNDDIKKDKNMTEDKELSSIEIHEPRWTFKNLYIDTKVKKIIEQTLTIAKYRQKLFEEWNLGNGEHTGRALVFNFYGPSGTGKSMTAEAIAGELGKKVYAVNYAELESKYVGETPKNIKKVFERAAKDNAVLIFDEADSFLGKRLTNVTQSADYGVNITRSVMLIELEKYDGIVIFTTNLQKNYDEAFKRRILADIPFSLPDEMARKEIWQLYLNRGMTLADGITPEYFAKKYINVSGADIKDITLYAAVEALEREGENAVLQEKDFDDAWHLILQRRTNSDANVTVKHERITQEQYQEEMNEYRSQDDKNVSSRVQ